MSSTQSNGRIKIKAASPDNEVEIKALIDLFSRAYGDRFPVKGVYEPKFWSTHINKRFISLLAYHNDQLCGHIAFQPERDHPRQVQVTLPVSDYAYLRANSIFASDVCEIVEDLASRQGWHSLYFFVFCSIPAMERISGDIFGLSSVGFFPAYLPSDLSPVESDSNNDTACSIMVTARCFPSFQRFSTGILYVPQQHRRVVQDLYQEIGVQREFREIDVNGQFEEAAIPADCRAIERQFFKRAGVEQLFVHPSLVSTQEFIDNLSMKDGVLSQYIFLDMRDRKCPDMCEDLEKLGFRFGGILPFVKGRESISYFRVSDNLPEWREHLPRREKAIQLKNYIDSYQHGEISSSFSLNEKENSFKSASDKYNSIEN